MSLSIYLPKDIEERLEYWTALTGHSKTYCILKAICEHLDNLEDVYLAECELERLRAGASTTVPLEEVMRRYGVEG